MWEALQLFCEKHLVRMDMRMVSEGIAEDLSMDVDKIVEIGERYEDSIVDMIFGKVGEVREEKVLVLNEWDLPVSIRLEDYDEEEMYVDWPSWYERHGL